MASPYGPPTPPSGFPTPAPHAPARRGVAGPIAALIGVGAFLGGCTIGGIAMAGGSSTPSAQATVTVTATPPAKAAAAPPKTEQPKTTPTKAAPVAPKTARMPSLIGQNGEVATDKLERLGVKNIRWGSADGTASVVLLPANWKVVKQYPRAGAKIKPGDLVVLTGVKLR